MCLFARKSRTKLEQNEPYGNACAVISIAQVATRKEVQTMDEKRQEEVMHEFMGDEGALDVPEKRIRNYQKGDASEVRAAYLQGVILQDGQFVSEGKCFFIGEESSDQRVSLKTLFIETDDPDEETSRGSEMFTYQEALEYLDQFADKEAEKIIAEDGVAKLISELPPMLMGATKAVAFICGKTVDEVNDDMMKLLDRKES